MVLEIHQGEGFAYKARDTAFCDLRDMILAVHDRQHHEWHLGVVLADPLKKIEAGHFRHHPIADDKVGLIYGFAKLLPSYLPIGSGINLVNAQRLKGEFNHRANIRLIVRDKYIWF